ncbi:MAG: hypothetical protein ACK5B9_08330 [Flavobacteriia bacterium]
MFCKYRIILSVDGAGIKSIIPLRILDYLHQSIIHLDDEIDVTSWVDVFSSLSLSSIFTGALMLKDENNRTKHTPKQILDFYRKRGTQIFSHNIGLNPENSTFPLSFTLEHFFGKVNMLDLKNHFLFISYDSKGEILFPFSNTMEKYNNLSLSKVMHACSAIPNIFPKVKVGQTELSDTLFKIQNPAQMAYDYARLLYPTDHLILLSIGTGEEINETPLSKSTREIDIKLKEQTLVDEKLTYFRFQPKLTKDFEVGNSAQEKIEELIDLTEDYIFQNRPAFHELIQLMTLRAV